MVYNKNKFKTASPVINSVNFTEFATGTGYVDYYLAQTETTAGVDYILTENTDYSAADEGKVILTVGADFDQDFDLSQFNRAVDIEGTANFSMPVYTASGTSLIPRVTLYKWNGVSEVAISEQVVGPTIGASKLLMIYFAVPIPYVHFAPGEVLRLRLEVDSTGSANVQFGLDPAGRSDATLTITTQTKISIPIRTNE